MTLPTDSKDSKIFLAIDANAIIHRAFHAYPPNLQTEGGLQLGD
jgi:5'-3' exonuclease